MGKIWNGAKVLWFLARDYIGSVDHAKGSRGELTVSTQFICSAERVALKGERAPVPVDIHFLM